jgi:hypothetical protein
MNDRYPHLRFLIDAAPVLAGGAGLLVLLCGTLRSCHLGGAGGFFSFLIVLVVALFVYVAVRAGIELLSALLEIETALRERLSAPQSTRGGEPPSP